MGAWRARSSTRVLDETGVGIMVGPARYLPRITCVAALLAGVCLTGRARAEVEVSIQVDSEERLELARRLVSELESEGYRAQITDDVGASPCEEGGTRPV